MTPIRHLGVLSMENWDDVWRRNQYLASRLVRSGAVEQLTFIGPPRSGLAPRATRYFPEPGIEAVTPPLVVPRSRPGGYRVLGAWLRRALAGADALWINDAASGVSALRPGIPAVYDVTDDWRSMPQPAVDRARTVAAEDVLAGRARTVVCSSVLTARWRDRYNIEATLIPNGVDLAALRNAARRELVGQGPHAMYVGTLHANRVDVDLVLRLAAEWTGTVHLVGPNALDEMSTAALSAAGVHLVGPVPAPEVASWLVSADLLICPHLVDDFTLSLDAIKAHEYLATDRPVVATASCGFQNETAAGLSVASAQTFVAAALQAVRTGPFERKLAVDWGERAHAFASVFAGEMSRAGRRAADTADGP